MYPRRAGLQESREVGGAREHHANCAPSGSVAMRCFRGVGCRLTSSEARQHAFGRTSQSVVAGLSPEESRVELARERPRVEPATSRKSTAVRPRMYRELARCRLELTGATVSCRFATVPANEVAPRFSLRCLPRSAGHTNRVSPAAALGDRGGVAENCSNVPGVRRRHAPLTTRRQERGLTLAEVARSVHAPVFAVARAGPEDHPAWAPIRRRMAAFLLRNAVPR